MSRFRQLACATALLGLALTGCSVNISTDATTTSVAPPPPCEGAASSEYGLGEAVRQSIAEFSSLPVRFSTGEGTVTKTPSTGKLAVVIDLCGPGADLDATTDAATTVARAVAKGAELGDHVATVTVKNPATSQSVVANPFNAATFASAATTASLRTQWRAQQGGN